MDRHALEQLEKILALADSSHESEALAAIRKARQILAQNGLGFGDLVRTALRPRFNLPFFSGLDSELDLQVVRLRQQIQDLQNALEAQAAQLEFWQRRAEGLEQNLNLRQAEASRWQQLARETVEKLWDLGQSIEAEEFASSQLTAAPAGGRKTA